MNLLAKLRAMILGARSHGFAYVSADEEPMKAASAGATIRNGEAGAPWIVVDHSLESIVVARWPGRLWKVEILQAAAEQASESASYTRAVSVRVLEELPVATLFGPQGHLVCNVIEKARTVSIEDVTQLGTAVTPLAREAYSRAWNRWLGETHRSDRAEDHAHTLAVVSGSGNGRSPIGSGFTVIHSVLTERARSLTGDAAFIVDEDGDLSFVSPWAEAAEVFLHAAMAYGAPELLSPADVDLLTAAWTKRYGASNQV